jgi:hypothetical protein
MRVANNSYIYTKSEAIMNYFSDDYNEIESEISCERVFRQLRKLFVVLHRRVEVPRDPLRRWSAARLEIVAGFDVRLPSPDV